MQLKSGGKGSMKIDFYPTKYWSGEPSDKFLKVLTLEGFGTQSKRVVDIVEMNQIVKDRLDFGYEVTGFNTSPQFIQRNRMTKEGYNGK